MKLWSKLKALFSKRRLEREMAEEMQAHLDGLTERNIAKGMSPKEARFAAQREFGGVEQIKEQVRYVRDIQWLENSFQDLRYGARQLRKAPGFATVAILTLALGIGATTAIFSVVNAVVFRPLDYPNADRLVSLHETYGPGATPGLVTRAAYWLWAEHAVSYAGLAAFRSDFVTVGETGALETLVANRVTDSYFATLQISPVDGRDFVAADETPDQPNVVILSDRYRVKKFPPDVDPVGQILRINNQRCTIIAVLPPNRELDQRDLYLPLSSRAADRDSLAPQDVVEVIGRLKPGISLKATEPETAILTQAHLSHFQILKNRGVMVRPLLDNVLSKAYVTTGVKPLLYLILGAVGILLLIACLNVANLLLARATTRRKEIAVRSSLGASRGRIVRQLLCESLLLSTIGGLTGTIAAYWGINFLKTFAAFLPRSTEISVDGRVLVFSIICSLLTSVVFGLYPALRATKVDLLPAMKSSGTVSGGPTTRRITSALIVAEVAMATLLLSGAGLLLHSLWQLQHVELGFKPEGVLANSLTGIDRKYPTQTQQVLFGDQLLERISALPQIKSAALTSGMPIFGAYGMGVKIAARPSDSYPEARIPVGLFACVTPQYFETLGIPLRTGRGFSARDVEGRPLVAIVSEDFARKYFPHENPLGQQISLVKGSKNEIWREIVGVVGDVKQQGPISDSVGMQNGYIYLPLAQGPSVISLLLAVRTETANDTRMASAVHSVIQSMDPDIAPKAMYQLKQGVDASIAKYRVSSSLFAFFSCIGVLLAAVGIYGVITYQVNERTSEIGIRMALGALPGDVLRLILASGVRLVGLGLLLGTLGALATTHLISSLLYKVSPYDPVSFTGILILLSGIAFLGYWIPARRAAKVDPMEALRCE